MSKYFKGFKHKQLTGFIVFKLILVWPEFLVTNQFQFGQNGQKIFLEKRSRMKLRPEVAQYPVFVVRTSALDENL
jgi:hypothetical protein